MKPRWPRFGVALSLNVVVPVTGAAAQTTTVRATIRDAADRAPVAGVRVALGSWLGGWTDAMGRVEFRVAAGRHQPRLSCPRRDSADLVANPPALAVSDSGAEVEWSLQDGRTCLGLLAVTPNGEFDGIFLGGAALRLFRLCGDTSYAIAINFSGEVWQSLERAVRRRQERGPLVIALRVRGQLQGPGFFGPNGEAGYALEAEVVKAVRVVPPAEACRS